MFGLLLAPRISAFKILASMYDGSIAAGGVRLHDYPVKVRVPEFGGSFVRVYPVALYTDRIKKYKYKLIRLTNPKTKKNIYGHVVDQCATGDCSKNKQKARSQDAILVDVHKKAWKPLGLKTYGLHALEGKLTTSKRYTFKNSNVNKVTTKDGQHGYVPNMWKI